jgi:predicted transcriptional regulator
MKKKRDRLQVIHDILKAIAAKNGTIRPTHILYKSNLSHQMMEEYLGELIGNGFVVEIKKEDRRTYALTEKGFKYLSQYKYISEFMDSFGLAEEVKPI